MSEIVASARHRRGKTRARRLGSLLVKGLGGGLLAASALCSTASPAAAFCGFFVSGADAKLYNNASQVVLMRRGNHTALTMSNNYKGPPQDFAMVVPVPVVLQKGQVKTLRPEVFAASIRSRPRGWSSTGSKTPAMFRRRRTCP